MLTCEKNDVCSFEKHMYRQISLKSEIFESEHKSTLIIDDDCFHNRRGWKQDHLKYSEHVTGLFAGVLRLKESNGNAPDDL